MTTAIHFGVYSNNSLRPIVAGHSDPSEEYEIPLPDVMHDAGVLRCFVSGSWACWGEHDQESEGDESLHVLFEVEEFQPRVTPQLIADLHAFVDVTLTHSGCRTVDHAFITPWNDWSEVEAIASIGGNPYVCLYDARITASGGRDPRGDVLADA